MTNRRNAIKIMAILGSFIGFKSIGFSGESCCKPLCVQYLEQITELFKKIKTNQTGNMLEASSAIARTIKNGGTCYSQWETGHSFDGDLFPDRPGDTNIFKVGYTLANPPNEPKKGDLLLLNVIRKPIDDPRAKGIFVIGGPNPWCADTEKTDLLTDDNRKLKIKMYSDIWIETYVTTYGALLWIPGASFPFGPTTAALNIITYWAMTADAVRLLARDGIPVQVRGDEPKLSGEIKYADINNPLAPLYLDECIRQTEMIQGELGTIGKIAKEAADCILSGGKLYVYSRYREALCTEASGKRGGLVLLKTTFADDKDFAGTNKDYVIMGIYQPDDPVDIQMLEKFKKAGIKTASIGPTTRNGVVPNGRTVPKESGIHLGYMCDTYGLFAIPGAEKKVSPTSGLLVNLMFWVTIVRLAEEIMARTGNVPEIMSTGAMKGGAEKRNRSLEIVKVRGY